MDGILYASIIYSPGRAVVTLKRKEMIWEEM